MHRTDCRSSLNKFWLGGKHRINIACTKSDILVFFNKNWKNVLISVKLMRSVLGV